jgi:hypothetical protein
MCKLTIAAAAIAFGALLASAPVQAEQTGGGPIRKGNQCFKFSQSMEKDGRFGSWDACPQAASVAVSANANTSATQGPRRRSASQSSR